MEGYILTELVDKVMQSCYSQQPATSASGPPAEAQQKEAEQIQQTFLSTATAYSQSRMGKWS